MAFLAPLPLSPLRGQCRIFTSFPILPQPRIEPEAPCGVQRILGIFRRWTNCDLLEFKNDLGKRWAKSTSRDQPESIHS